VHDDRRHCLLAPTGHHQQSPLLPLGRGAGAPLRVSAGQQAPAEAPLFPIVRSNKILGMAVFVREMDVFVRESKEEDEVFTSLPPVVK
jgi:hypothetical protein